MLLAVAVAKANVMMTPETQPLIAASSDRLTTAKASEKSQDMYRRRAVIGLLLDSRQTVVEPMRFRFQKCDRRSLPLLQNDPRAFP